MKVALSELHHFLVNPEDWAEHAAKATGSPRMSYTHVTRMAAYRFHQTKDVAAARTALTKYLDSYHLSNEDRRANAHEQLDAYINWVASDKPIVIAYRARIVVDLASGLYTSGQIHRVDLDLVSGGYRAVLLGADMHSASDPRAAILQHGYAMSAGRSEDSIQPTHQNLDGSGLTALALSRSQRENMLDALRGSAARAAKVLSRLRS